MPVSAFVALFSGAFVGTFSSYFLGRWLDHWREHRRLHREARGWDDMCLVKFPCSRCQRVFESEAPSLKRRKAAG